MGRLIHEEQGQMAAIVIALVAVLAIIGLFAICGDGQ